MNIEPIKKKEIADVRNVNTPNASAIVTSKISKKPSTATATTATMKATKTLASKTKASTTTVTKITKLVLKPKAEHKPRFTLTTTQHISRQTASSASIKPPSSLDKTYRIRNINAAKRLSIERTGGSLIPNGIKTKPKITSKENKSIESNIQEIVAVPNSDVQLDQTKPLNNGVLEEITSAVVNANAITAKPASARKSMAFEIQNTPKKQTKPHMLATVDKSAEKCKQKSYDPVKARQFIRQQQEKRKLDAKEMAKASANQDEIKKRLDVLRRNSLKILNKNVKRARSSVPSIADVKTTKVEHRRKSDKFEAKAGGSVERRPSDASSAVIMSQRSQRERIGILRRPDDAAPVMLAPLTTPLSRGNNAKSKISPQPINDEFPALAVNETPKSEPKNDLQMPLSMSLKSSLLMTNLSTPNDDRNNEMRFWLRPTPVQPYPYNFIMAVRKKLELVTHPVLKSSSGAVKSRSTPIFLGESRKTSSEVGDKLKSPDSLSSKSATRASRSEFEPSNQQQRKSDHYSEDYSTNFSSVTLKTIDRSQTQANDILSSTKISSQPLPVANEDSQDTLSISSGILSHSSPEKKQTILKNKIDSIERQPTPLSTNHADSLHIVSRSSSHRSTSTSRHANGSGDASGSVDVQKMLSDFNQSLSQVIRVNQQLHSVLSNPPSLRTASISEQQPTTSTEEYSDDVDNFASERPTNEKTTTESKTPSTVTPSEQIATDGESIAESVTATQSELEGRQSSTIKESDTIKSSIAEEVPSTASARAINDEQIDDENLSARSFQKHIFDGREVMNTSIGSDIFTIMKQTAAIDFNSSTWSDGNVSYSNLGMVRKTKIFTLIKLKLN